MKTNFQWVFNKLLCKKTVFILGSLFWFGNPIVHINIESPVALVYMSVFGGVHAINSTGVICLSFCKLHGAKSCIYMCTCTCTCVSIHPSFIASCACTCECACSTLMRATLNWTGINWEAWRLGEKPKDSGSETMACTYTQEHPPEDGYKTAYTWGRFAMI